MGLRCSQLETNQMSSARPCKKTYARLKTLRRSEMEIENLICYTERAVGLKPSAIQGEARLRGLYRSIYSKTLEDETTRIILLFQRRSLDPGMRRITARKSSTQRRTAETLSAQRTPNKNETWFDAQRSIRLSQTIDFLCELHASAVTYPFCSGRIHGLTDRRSSNHLRIRSAKCDRSSSFARFVYTSSQSTVRYS